MCPDSEPWSAPGTHRFGSAENRITGDPEPVSPVDCLPPAGIRTEATAGPTSPTQTGRASDTTNPFPGSCPLRTWRRCGRSARGSGRGRGGVGAVATGRPVSGRQAVGDGRSGVGPCRPGGPPPAAMSAMSTFRISVWHLRRPLTPVRAAVLDRAVGAVRSVQQGDRPPCPATPSDSVVGSPTPLGGPRRGGRRVGSASTGRAVEGRANAGSPSVTRAHNRGTRSVIVRIRLAGPGGERFTGGVGRASRTSRRGHASDPGGDGLDGTAGSPARAEGRRTRAPGGRGRVAEG